jgi:DUF917 family protein
LITKKDEMLSALTKEASIGKVTIEDKEHELSSAKVAIIDLASAKEKFESSISSLKRFKTKNFKYKLANARYLPPHL